MENNKQPLNEEKVFKKGMKLTVVGHIVDIGGNTIFADGQKVTIKEVLKNAGRWSNFFGIYYPEKITGFKLNCTYGIWSTKTFKETLNIK